MPQRISYLSQLRFKPELLASLQAKYLSQIRFVLLLVLAIVVIGIFAFTTIPRRLNPEIKIPIVVVNTVLPGASPEDVESLVTIPLEDKLNDIKRLDTMTSTSRESSSTIILQFLSTVNSQKAQQDVQNRVDTVIDLPADHKTPTVQALDFENQPIWTFAVTTTADPATLMRFSTELKDKLKDLPKIDQVQTSGLDVQQIEVVIDPAKIREYGLNPVQLSQIVQKAAGSYPAGSVNTNTSTFALSIDKEIFSVEDIRNLRITSQGQTIHLSDVATVQERSASDQFQTFYASKTELPKQVVQFYVYKTSNANIDAAGKEAKDLVENTIASYHGTFAVTTILNSAEEITKQFNDLFGEFQSTIILVFILLLLFLGLRQAIISSITVPLTFLSAFAIIQALGLSLNFLTMFAFLLSLGLLIDDTIVSVAAMTRYYKTGRFTPYETGILVWKDFIVPLWSTTITTIWAFVPLLLASGIIGEFIKSIPIVVTATMLSSTTIAVLITIPLMIVFLKPQFPRRVTILIRVFVIAAILMVMGMVLPKNGLLPVILLLTLVFMILLYSQRVYLKTQARQYIRKNKDAKFVVSKAQTILDHGVVNIEALSNAYMAVIDQILRSKVARRNTLIALGAFALFAYLLVPLGFVKNEFFPKTDEDLMYMNVELPSGTNRKTSTTKALELLEKLRQTEVVNFVVLEVGQSITAEADRASGANIFLYTLHLPPKKSRSVSSQDLAARLRERYGSYSDGTVSVQELSGGPPAGADVQVTLLGDDLGVLNQYIDKLSDFLKKQPGVTNVDRSIKTGTSKLVFVPDDQKLTEQNISLDTLGLWLRTYAGGFILHTIKFGKDEKDIVFRTSSQSQTPEQIGSIAIPTQQGAVPLISLGTLKVEQNPTTITREGGKRSLSVFAGVTAGTSAVEANNKLLTYADTIQLPSGYSWKTGGVNEENQKSIQSILQAMLISFLLILITMVIEFGSFRQAIIALLIIPLAISGVFYIFALTGIPLSFPALIGILALFGIVVTHAIVVIEKINDNRREHMPLREAIVDAAGNRLEPVLLTSLATIVGLVPITLADPLWRGLGGAIIAGLLFSGAIKLFFVPVMYYILFREQPPRSIKSTRGTKRIRG